MSSPARPSGPELIALGECMVELSGEQALGTMPATLRMSCGGDVLNALVSASRLGTRCGFITRVGEDPFAQGMLALWREEAIDLRHAALVPGRNGVYFIAVREDGERDFTYRRAGSAASALSPADIDPAYLGSARAVLLSGITQAISGSAQAATLKLAQLARERGLLVAYDPNYRASLWHGRGGLPAAQAALSELLPLVDWLLPSRPADSLLLEAHRLSCAVAWKSGAEGALLCQGGQALPVPAEAVAEVLDSTGAGDAWNGAFLHGLLSGVPAASAAAAANRVAAATLGHRGAIAPRS